MSTSPYERFALGLDCARCGGALKGTDVQADLGIATCGQCGAVLDLKNRLANPLARAESAPVSAPPPSAVPMPRGYEIDEAAGVLRIQRRWFKLSALGMLGFAAFWDLFLVSWYANAARAGDWMVFVFPLLHVAVGVGITYSSIAGLVNTTHLTVDRDTLTVSHRPLPWLGGGRHARADLVQLYVERTDRRGAKGSTGIAYDLCAFDRDARKRTLLKGLETAGEGLWLERVLEQRLGISPAPVAGAVSG